MNICLISGPTVIIRVSEAGADRIRAALREQVRQAKGGPFEQDWQDLVDLVSLEMNVFYNRRLRVRRRGG